NDFSEETAPEFDSSQAAPGAPDACPALCSRNRPERRTRDARRRCSDRLVQRDEPLPGAHVSRSGPLRSRSAANRGRGAATSASRGRGTARSGRWKRTYFAWLTASAPILTSWSRQGVWVQLMWGKGLDAAEAGPAGPRSLAGPVSPRPWGQGPFRGRAIPT